MQTKCRLDRSDLRRRGRDDVIARQRELETATQANAVNTGDQRNWQKLHEAQKFDAVQSPIFTALICAACLHTFLEDIQICAGGEMPQSATDDDGAAACPL